MPAHDPSHTAGCGCSQEVIDGVQDFLYNYIDQDKVEALNSSHPGKQVIKPWDLRLDETAFVGSDADEQLIIRIQFTGLMKCTWLLSLFRSCELELKPTMLYSEIYLDQSWSSWIHAGSSQNSLLNISSCCWRRMRLILPTIVCQLAIRLR